MIKTAGMTLKDRYFLSVLRRTTWIDTSILQILSNGEILLKVPEASARSISDLLESRPTVRLALTTRATGSSASPRKRIPRELLQP